MLRVETALLHKGAEKILHRKFNNDKSLAIIRKNFRTSMKYIIATNHYLKKSLHSRYTEKKLLKAHLEQERAKGETLNEHKMIKICTNRLKNLKGTMNRIYKMRKFEKFEDVLKEFSDDNIFGKNLQNVVLIFVRFFSYGRHDVLHE